MSKHLKAKNKNTSFPQTAEYDENILANLECGIILLDSSLSIIVLNQWMINHSNLKALSYKGEKFLSLFPHMKNTQLAKSIAAVLQYEIKSALTPDINLDPLPLFEKDLGGATADSDRKKLDHTIYISPVRDGDGNLQCLLQIQKIASATIRDMRHQELSQKMLSEAEILRQSFHNAQRANKAKSEFLALMSHELRTPLNAIIGFSDILKDELLGEHAVSQYKEYSTDISDAGNHLLNLINDILDISKIDAGKYSLYEEDVDIAEVVRSTKNLIGPQIQSNKQNLTIHIPEDIPDLRVDSRSLKQMILNLLSNAVKFTPDGGSIEIIVLQNKAEEIQFMVRDNGIGIAPREIPMLLLPFTQSESKMSRQKQGTGLGLALVKKMIELHDGHIQVESQIGKGTSITLTFPKDRAIKP